MLKFENLWKCTPEMYLFKFLNTTLGGGGRQQRRLPRAANIPSRRHCLHTLYNQSKLSIYITSGQVKYYRTYRRNLSAAGLVLEACTQVCYTRQLALFAWHRVLSKVGNGPDQIPRSTERISCLHYFFANVLSLPMWQIKVCKLPPLCNSIFM